MPVDYGMSGKGYMLSRNLYSDGTLLKSAILVGLYTAGTGQSMRKSSKATERGQTDIIYAQCPLPVVLIQLSLSFVGSGRSTTRGRIAIGPASVT